MQGTDLPVDDEKFCRLAYEVPWYRCEITTLAGYKAQKRRKSGRQLPAGLPRGGAWVACSSTGVEQIGYGFAKQWSFKQKKAQS